MLVTDELKRRKRTVGLMFFDFVEALARLAEFIGSPSMELLAEKVELYYNKRYYNECAVQAASVAIHIPSQFY